HFAAEGGRQEALLLLLGAERHDRRDQPRRDAHVGPTHLAGREFLRDDDLLDWTRRTTPRLGQVGHHPTALGDRDRSLIPRNRFQRCDFRAYLLPKLVGLRVEFY